MTFESMLDAEDIARLYGSHSRPLVAYFARRTFDAQVAAELMAETYERIEELAGLASLRAEGGGGDRARAA
jgi:RNA polymerase sigma-70 factor (ECF subfamily)